MAALKFEVNQTLAAIDLAMYESQDSTARPYLGMSGIGNPCERANWMAFHWVAKRMIEAKNLRAIEDGFAGEDVMAARLRKVKGITLYTVDPATGKQFGQSDHGGHFRGHLDGAIQGLLEAQKTWHVWEHKQVNETKFKKLITLTAEVGEKNALQKWDVTYYAQAQCYMGYTGMDRHFITVASPGGRDYTSVRTEFSKEDYEKYVAKALRVIHAPEPAERIGDATFFTCKWCDHYNVCHGTDAPDMNCRTCAHSTAEKDGTWTCAGDGRVLSVEEQRIGCNEHRINPSIIKHWAVVVDANHEQNWVEYQHLKSGHKFMNGPGPDGFLSREIKACTDKDGLVLVANDSSLMNLRKQFGGELVA